MEPGQPREAREPGPGAETAAVPRWEEAKTFYDNLSSKKKPKSVKAWLGFGGTREGPFPGRGLKPSGKGLVEPLPKVTRFLRPRMCPAVGWGSSLFWELCYSGSASAPPHTHTHSSRAQVLLQNTHPPCCHQGPIPSSAGSLNAGTALVGRAAQQPGSSALASVTWEPGCSLGSQVSSICAVSSAS